jgi:hypothetical protein
LLLLEPPAKSHSKTPSFPAMPFSMLSISYTSYSAS